MINLMEYTSKIWGKCKIVHAGQHRDDTPMLRIVDAENGEPIATLTVCMPAAHTQLKTAQYIIKTWSENQFTTDELLELGIFTDTGLRFPNGYVEAQVWKLNQEWSDGVQEG